MATTTNYGWTTPDDTALVKDGASAIRTLGSSVDTTTKNLNPETTLGDIAYRSSTANVKTRLGLGTAGQVLTVNSGANAPEWAAVSAGGMTLISTTTLSGTSTTVSSIPSTYNSLMFIIRGMTASASGEPRFKINGTTSAHEFVGVFGGGSAIEATNNNGAQMTYGQNMDQTDDDNCWTLKIDNYASSTTPKSWTFYGVYVKSTTDKSKIMLAGGYSLTTAVSSLDIVASSGTFSGGSILTYGVK